MIFNSKNNTIKILLLIFIVIVIYLYIIKKKNISENKWKYGYYEKVSGDKNQPLFMIRSKNKIHYHDNYRYYHSISNILFFDNIKYYEHIGQNKSKSLCKMKSMKNDSIGTCNGYGTNKFSKKNVGYNSKHFYWKIKNQIYYSNVYIFDDGDISTAVYRKIKSVKS